MSEIMPQPVPVNQRQSVRRRPATDFPSLVPAGVNALAQLQGCGSSQTAVGRENCNHGVHAYRYNGGFSDYNGFQAEFRANNLLKQLTIRSATRSQDPGQRV